MLAIPSAKIPEALIPDARGVVINPLGVNVQLTVHRPKKKKPEGIGRSECLPESWKDRKR